MRELRQVAVYFVALLALCAAGYAAAGLTTGPVYSLVSSIAAPQPAHSPPAESMEPAISLDAADRLPVWIAPTPTYSYAPPSGAEHARQSARNEGRRERRSQRPAAMSNQSRKPGQITVAPFQREVAEPR